MKKPCKFARKGYCKHKDRLQEMLCNRDNCPWPERKVGIGSGIWWQERELADPKEILLEFVQDIDATGGIFKYKGTETFAPVGSKDWTDLGETYRKACKALGRRPHVKKED